MTQYRWSHSFPWWSPKNTNVKLWEWCGSSEFSSRRNDFVIARPPSRTSTNPRVRFSSLEACLVINASLLTAINGL